MSLAILKIVSSGLSVIRNRRVAPLLLGVLVLVGGIYTPARGAVVIDSTPFSIGLVASSITGVQANWTDDDGLAANNVVPGGLFSMSVSVVSEAGSSAGPRFHDAYAFSNGPGVSGYNNGTPAWAATLSASYAGSGDALIIRVDSISLYGVAFTSVVVGPSVDVAFTEPSQSASSATTPLGNTTDMNTAANYTQFSWNPADYNQSLASAVRTFGLSSNDGLALDGFLVTGVLEVVALPEPTSCALLLAGTSLLLRRHQRRAVA
jgi:hypothetical protein